MIKSCSFSVVQSNRQVAESESSVVTVSLPRSAIASMAWIIEDLLTGSFWVLRPRCWSEIRVRRCCLADCDWVVIDEQVILEVGFGGIMVGFKGAGRRRQRHVAMEKGIQPTRGEWLRLERYEVNMAVESIPEKTIICSLMDQLVQGPNIHSTAHIHT